MTRPSGCTPALRCEAQLDLFSADPTYPVYGVRAGLSVHKRMPRKHNPKLMPAPRIADRF